MAILGILAMIVTLSGPVAALAVMAPCNDASMARMATADDMESCKPAVKACAEPCLTVGSCQSQCGGSIVPLVRVDPNDLALTQFKMRLHAALGELPPGTVSPVDGPPPRL